jgi:hypothetical protein
MHRFMTCGLAALVLGFVAAAGASAESGEVEVEVTGSGSTKDAALDDALRKAVEKGAGVEVSSRTETLDHEVAFDRIVTRAKGYVSKYEVTEEKQKWDLWRVTIRATVNKGQIQSDWGEVQMLLERKGRPTVMVLIQESVFDRTGKAQQALTDYAASAIEQLLLSKNFQLKSSVGLQEAEKRNRDAAIAKNDLDALAAIARRNGANVMIIGKSTCRFGNAAKAQDVEIIHYQATASITAYNSDTCDLLLSTTMEGKGSGVSEVQAISLAFKRVSEKVSDDVLKKLLNKWYFEFQQGASLVLSVEIQAGTEEAMKLAGKMAIRLQEALKGIEGVKDARMDFTKENEKAFATFTVDTKLTLEDLRNRIMGLDLEGAGFTLEWIGSDKNTLRFTLQIK